MVYIGDCIPCQYGYHEEHQDVPGPVAEGIIGGWKCECKGECVERKNQPIKFGPPLDTSGVEEFIKLTKGIDDTKGVI